MKTLTLNWTTAGWRFRDTKIFAKDFVEKWKVMQDIQLKNLDEFYNLDEASGEWLDAVGSVFGITRDYVRCRGDSFILDADKMDVDNTYLDGHEGELLDPLYRALIKLKTASSRKLFCMPNLRQIVVDLFGEENVEVKFIENKEPYSETFRAQYFQMHIYFIDPTYAPAFVLLVNVFPNIFDKPMGISYDVFCHYDEE
jgi:hypothetical protein